MSRPSFAHPCPWNRDKGVGVGIDFGDVGPRYPGGYHYGIDFFAPEGSPILAAAPGLVIAAERMGAYGLCVHLYHEDDELFSIYGHLSRILVAVGDEVEAEQQVGGCGSTGNSSGNHLHFEVRAHSDEREFAVDPMLYIDPRPEYWSGAWLRRT